MNRLREALNPKITKIIVDSYPVVRNRTALWFFTEDLKKQSENDPERTKSGKPCPMKRSVMLKLWHNMEPESKRKYFNMAEFDEFRYKEQRALWIAEVGSLLAKYGNRIVDRTDVLPEKNQIASFEGLKKNYENMIQSESTKTLYKDAVDKVFRLNSDMNTEELMSAVPENYRPVLERPRRPLTSFMQFASDNKDLITQFRKEKKPDSTFMQAAAHLWYRLPEEERASYEKQYEVLVESYNLAMNKFKESLGENCNQLELASKEKRAFRKSLRKKLRATDVVPINVRNAFNFYVSDHKDKSLIELKEMWHNLPEEEKNRYRKMNEEDSTRYYNESRQYREFLSKVLKLVAKKNPKLDQ